MQSTTAVAAAAAAASSSSSADMAIDTVAPGSMTRPLMVTVEPPYLTANMGGKILHDIVDGNPVFEECVLCSSLFVINVVPSTYIYRNITWEGRKKDASTKLRETLSRIITEKGADFANLTIEGIQDSDFNKAPLSDDEEDGDATAKEHKKDASADAKPDVPITYEDLTTMRQEALLKLESVSLSTTQYLFD